jgi:hypothetical protein
MALIFTYKDNEYTLEFTRNTVMETERMGFDMDKLDSAPVTSLTLLFRGAFLAHHRTLTIAEVDDILVNIDKEGLLPALGNLYMEAIKPLIENEEHSKNAIKWTVKT